MNAEDRLRRAIEARTRTIEPSDDGLQRINDKLLAPGGDMNITPQNRWYLVAAAAAVVLALAGGALLLVGGDDGDTTTIDGPDRDDTTTTEATTTTAPTTTTEAPAVGPEVPDGGPTAEEAAHIVWPRPSSDVRFDDPVDAASSWARFYAGFTDPFVGEYRAGDGRSGEVPVFPLPSGQGAETTVLVRQLGDDHWYVVATTTQDVTVTAPAADARLACPQPLAGTALAYEGTVQVRIDGYLPDGRRVEIASGFVTGSGSPPARPFEGELACGDVPPDVEPYGIVNFFTTDEGEVGGNLVAVTFPIELP